MRYQEVSTDIPPGEGELPRDPPVYEDIEAQCDDGTPSSSQRNSQDSLVREFEIMEMEDPGPAMLSLSQRWRSSFRSKVRAVRTNVLDPLAEGYSHCQRIWEMQLARLGNPLIVKRFVYVIAVAIVVFFVATSGFMPEDNSKQGGSFSDRSLLLDFAKSIVDLGAMEEHLEYLSSLEHISGTAGDLVLAKYIEKYFDQKELVFDGLEEMKTLSVFPESITLKFDQEEWDLTHQFNFLSKDGEVENGIVYMNHGTVSDFAKLDESKVDYQGAICLMKYGRISESEKMLIAENKGCAAVLFTSESDAFPDSAERRGVGIPQFYPGDPHMEGWYTDETPHADFPDSRIPKIPSAVLTWNQAKKIWDKLSNGVKFDFNSGDKTLRATFKNQIVTKQDHLSWNVNGEIIGKEQKDKVLVIGAARDAPCTGAVNPNTGTVILLELINVLYKLRTKFNWKPLRTIRFISLGGSQTNFDGAVLHSTTSQSMFYLDLSEAIAGDDLEVTSSPLLESTLNLYKDEYNLQFKKWDKYSNALPFIGKGVPSMTVGYKGKKYPQYSCDDTFENFKSLQIDPQFEKHRDLLEFVLKIVLHLVDDPLIPFDMNDYEKELKEALAHLEDYAKKTQPAVNYEFNNMKTAISNLGQIGREMANWERAWKEIVDEDGGLEPSLLTVHRWNWNNKLSGLEKFFIGREGLPSRWWYKNYLFSPQMFNPEDDDLWWTFPSIRDALFFGQDAQLQIETVAQLIMDGVKHFIQR
ncbi:Zn-dependent exopeptidase [Cyberlindnera jadinii NRRL Y-1542]|uniref:Zn-dependent exopeptidase n=1 Tax=Cyberlindnera jadinii (strain ATCC 18201 / CBS 1600 / BCRC 20928 / JCM 3617 / NBRC 0987 / NRRL Y-1542) TaxID=983966 RepID=A0A1E4S9F5_CYBJN|nr:Zn-dependent exopeptidase [Cyberlindnera jadinii NRRL Y-1542]ODV76108.1 Zn-dependent exopeptidase [Cyberlindnera jadinii NRRL Y-1542]